MAETLSGRRVIPFPPIYSPDLLDETRAKKRLSGRPIRILYAGSNHPPERFRSLWRGKPELAKWGDALIEAAPRDFTVPLPEHARKVIAELGGELDQASPLACELLDAVGKYLWASHKERVLRILARYPCHLFLSRAKLPYEIHPQARVFENVPFPIYQDMMHESRAVVATLPSYITGGISERVCDPLVRGAVTIAARNNGLMCCGLELGREVLDFGADCAELEGYLERVMAGDPELQEVADAGREAGLRLFDPGKQMGEFMAKAEQSWREEA